MELIKIEDNWKHDFEGLSQNIKSKKADLILLKSD